MELTIFVMTILFVYLLQVAIPFIVKRTVVFGVTIPYKHTNHPTIKAYKRLYAVITFIIGATSLIGYFIWTQSNNVTENELVLTGAIIPFVILFTGFALYFYYHFKTINLKQSQKWFQDVKQVHYADLAIRSKDEMLSSVVHFIPTILTITIAVLTMNMYDQLPSQIPTHWGPDGQPDAFTDKNWLSVLMLPIILFLLQIMFFAINEFTKRSGIKVNAGNVDSSKLRQLRLRKYTSWFLFLMNILMTILFTYLQLNLLYENLFSDSLMLITPLVIMVVTLAGSLVLAVKVGRVDSDLDKKLVVDHPNNPGTVEGVDEDQHWKGGLFYFNRNDPSIFVEKRFGIGWTMNFANPIGYLIILLPLALILILTFAM